MTWDGVVTKYHKKHIKELGVTPTIEAYIQSKGSLLNRDKGMKGGEIRSKTTDKPST
jgi:hypothetical protein